MYRPVLLAALAVVLSAIPALAQLETPEQFLGRPVGEDRYLFDWDQIRGYFEYVDQNSDRLHLEVLGQSTQGRPFVLAVIGDEEAVAQRDQHRQNVRALYDVAASVREGRSAEDRQREARRLAADGRVLVALSLGLHSNEVGASQASMEMLYDLVTREDDAMRHVRQNVLVLMVPSMNPDGLDIVTNWYRRTVGTEAEGSFPPELYHHYAGHDNNRDGFFNRLPETALWSKVLYHDWMPQIILDEHQMGSSGPRLFLPPFDDPVSPSVHPLVFTQLSAAGQHMVSELTALGHSGIATSTIFTAEWPGSVRSTGFWHNMLGILSEVASARFATPLYFPPGSMRGGGRGLPKYERRANFVDPWPGGWWRLRDIVDIEKDLTWSLLGWAATQREALLYNFYQMGADATEKGMTEAPYGFLIPLDQHDRGSANRAVELLLAGGIEVTEMRGDRGFRVSSAQPFRPFLVEMLDPPDYPMIRESGTDSFIRPYDVTAWSLPDLLGIRVESVLESPYPTGGIQTAVIGDMAIAVVDRGGREADADDEAPLEEWAIFDARDNASYRIVMSLLSDEHEVLRVSASDEVLVEMPVGDETFVMTPDEVGNFVLATAGADLKRRAREAGVSFRSAAFRPDWTMDPLATPRVGLYAPWGGSMDEGWTRWVLDHHNVPHERVRNDDFDPDKVRQLKRRFNTLVFPSIRKSTLERGNGYGRARNAYTPVWPEQYRGSLGGEDTGKVLREFVEDGGTVVAFDDATPWIVQYMGLPVRVALDDLDRDDFYAPGTLVSAEVDTSHPLAWGMPSQVAAYFASGLAYRPIAWPRPTGVPVRYADNDVRVAGFLLGEEHMAGLPAMLDIPMGKGRVVLFGFKPQHRGQTEATFKLLLNALLAASN